MVDLPTKQYPVTTTHPIQPGVSPSEVAQPYAELADTLAKSGEAAETVSVEMAKQAGAQAVSRDANGDIVVQKAPFVGPAAQVFDHSVKVAALAEADGAAQRADIALRTEFRNDPQGYLKAAEEFARGQQQKMTAAAGFEVGNALFRSIDRTTTQTYRGLLNEQEALQLKSTDAAITTGIQSARDDLVAMARGGVTAGPDWDAALDKVRTLTAQKVANPRMAYPQVQADYDLQHLQGELAASGFLYHVDQTYKNAPSRAEGAQAALDYAKGILTDRSLKLTEQQRDAYYHKAVGEIHANEAIRRQDIAEARLAETNLRTTIALGGKVEPETIEGIATMFKNAGDQAGAARLYAAAVRMPLAGEFNRMPLADQTKQLAAIRGQAAAKAAYDFFVGRGYTPAQASGIVGNLIHESGLDPQAIHDQGTGIGIAGFRNERAAALAQFARERGTSPTDFQTQLEFIDKELRSTEGRAFQALQAATTSDEAAAAFIHYERPRGYNPNDVTGADQYASRVALSRQVFTGQGNISTDTPASALWLQANRARSLDTAARAQWKQVWEDYTKEGIRPPDKVVNDILDAARAVGDHDLLETMAAAGDRLALVQDAAQRSLPAQAAQIAEMRRLGGEGLLSPGQQGVQKDLERRYSSIQTGLADNPIATTVANFGQRFKAPAALNVADPDQLAAGLAYRGRIAQFAAQNWQTKPVAALDKADLAALSGALDAADPPGKIRIFNAITAALPEDVRNATLAKLGEKGPDMMVAAAASTMMRDAPDVAQSVLRGQQALKVDPRFNPEKEGKDDFGEQLDKRMPVSVFPLAGRTDPNGPYATARGMIKARYADLAAQAGDTGGKLNEDRLQKAVDDVTGGVLDHNGGKFLAPARGVSQSQFDALLFGLNDSDLAGVTTLAGEPITAGYLRSNAQLESVAPGRYLVRLGRDAMAPIYAYQNANTEIPQKFVLDMRNRRPGRVPFISPYTLEADDLGAPTSAPSAPVTAPPAPPIAPAAAAPAAAPVSQPGPRAVYPEPRQ